MRLSMQDKNEFLKAAVKARKTSDLDGLINWVVSAVEAIDALPDGKADAPCPAYQECPYPYPADPYALSLQDAQRYSPILPVPGLQETNGAPPHDQRA